MCLLLFLLPLLVVIGTWYTGDHATLFLVTDDVRHDRFGLLGTIKCVEKFNRTGNI